MKSVKWLSLLDKLEMTDESPIDDVIDTALSLLHKAESRAEGLEDRISELESVKCLPDEYAARLVHSQHSDAYLVDLSLCPHPDCCRLWSGV